VLHDDVEVGVGLLLCEVYQDGDPTYVSAHTLTRDSI
jgi:hypothetical protein